MARSFYAFIVILCLTLSFCGKEGKDYKSEGIILGPDIRACICCGGWFIKIDTTTYEFNSLPDNSGIDLQKESFPLKVRLDWTLSEGACPNNRIDIQRIEKE
jgi:hypothetical protein